MKNKELILRMKHLNKLLNNVEMKISKKFSFSAISKILVIKNGNYIL